MNNLRWKIAQAAEIRWWQSYLKKKDRADYLQWKKGYWREFLNKAGIAVKPNEAILDAGCGPAGIFMIFENNRVDALDPLLQQYREKIDHFNPANYPWVSFHSNALEKFETKNTYDTVFCLNAINHVADLDLCMDQLVAVTKPGGTMVLSIDAHNYSGFKKIFRWLPGDILHPHQYNLAEYQKMLLNRNCTIHKSILLKKEFLFNYYVIIATVNKYLK